ncbi:O-fucosylpeptide 3-beta-N-acetylglucosaminyltransferase [Bertholletia excelsa]
MIHNILSNRSCCPTSPLFTSSRPSTASLNVSHIVFGITSSSNTWPARRTLVESWWRPNLTRGYIFLDSVRPNYFPWPPSSPPFRVSENTTRYKDYDMHKAQQAIRMVLTIVELVKDEKARWFVMMDDDTVIFVDNLVEVLGKYDHRRYFYVGASSESISSNFFHSFEMAFGGGGYALSRPLAEALAKNMDICIRRYPTLYGSDHIVQSFAADFGVSLTQEKGFLQIDLHRDISGFLSALPQSLLLSLHHFDAAEPIFPFMTREQSLAHLMKAAKTDESRLLQQTICYHVAHNWTVSISWGYSVQVYDGFRQPSVLQRPLEKFIPWTRVAKPPYMFHTRHPCEATRVLFFDSVEEINGTHIVTSYNRTSPRRCRAYPSRADQTADRALMVRVVSPTRRYSEAERRRECCDITYEAGTNTTDVRLRDCLEDEILA